MKTILAVDDSVINLKSIKRLLSDKYKVVAVNSAADALIYLKGNIPDLILLDILMPDMDGFEMMEELRKDSRYDSIPVIFLTADNDKEKELRGFRMGAMDFIVKPFEPDIVRSRIEKTLELEGLRHNLEEQVEQKTSEIQNITLQSIMAVANTVDSKEYLAKHHSVNVARISEEIAKRLGWNSDKITNLHYIALLHDIGNIGIPDNLFNKTGRFTKEEYSLVKRHTIIGADILDNTSIDMAREGARFHHERYDGQGYPDNRAGEDIPIEARIIAVADAYDAMSNDRSYKKKMNQDQIVEELTKERGHQFDPLLTDIMIDIIREGEAEHIVMQSTPTISKGIVGESTSLLQKVMTEYAVEAQNEANKDPLTGLWNRKYAASQVNRMLSQPEPHGTAFMIDIDNFKGINDRFGHIAGDEILIDIAKVLSDVVRQNDIACRIGGDEFFLFFNEMDNTATIRSLAARLIKSLNDKVKYPDGKCGVCASVGVAIAPKDGTEFEILYFNADKALYHAKNNGKNTYHFFSNDVEEENPLDGIQEDLLYIRKMLQEQEPIKGSYCVEYEGFKNISRFIRRGMERNERQVVYILFTLTGREGAGPNVDTVQPMINCLEDVIKESLRVGDVATRYSNSQMVVILMDTNMENADAVANRIFSDFLKRISDTEVELHYDLQQLDITNN